MAVDTVSNASTQTIASAGMAIADGLVAHQLPLRHSLAPRRTLFPALIGLVPSRIVRVPSLTLWEAVSAWGDSLAHSQWRVVGLVGR